MNVAIVPLDGEVIAKHSGESSNREWNADHSQWLAPGDFLLRDKQGRIWHVHVRLVG